MSKTVLFDIIL